MKSERPSPARVGEPGRAGSKVVNMSATRRIGLRENGEAYAFLLPAMVVFMAFVLIPAVQSVAYSFTKWEGIGAMRWVGLKNYVDLFTKTPLYWETLGRNIVWAFGAATIPVVIGLLQANLLVRGKVKGSNFFQLVFFLPQVISTVVVAIIWKWIFDPVQGPISYALIASGRDGLDWLGNPGMVMIALFIVYVWQAYGFDTIVFGAAIQGIDENLYDAARLDGCGPMRQFAHVTLPGIRPNMTTVLLLSVIWSFQIFDLVYTMTAGGPGYSSYVISYYVYYEGFIANHVGFATSMSITLTAIILCFSLLFMRIRERGEK